MPKLTKERERQVCVTNVLYCSVYFTYNSLLSITTMKDQLSGCTGNVEIPFYAVTELYFPVWQFPVCDRFNLRDK